MLEQASGVSQTISPKLERDWLKMGICSLAAGGLQRAQQSIAPQIMVRLRPGHGFMSFRFRFQRNQQTTGMSMGPRGTGVTFALFLQVSSDKSAHSPGLDCHVSIKGNQPSIVVPLQPTRERSVRLVP